MVPALRHRLAVLATAVFAIGGVAAVPVAEASTGAGEDGGSGTIHGPVRAQITFVKNWKQPFRSRVTWDVWHRRTDGSWHVIDHASWRAGSGFGGAGTRDSCVRDRGWLPDGRYSFVQYDDYHGNLIHGRAFFLTNKACRNGTVRQDLFIHTESGAGNRQCADVPGDQLCRWELTPKINDYRSHGCIKMSPGDIADLTRHFHQYYRPLVRYRLGTVSVLVR